MSLLNDMLRDLSHQQKGADPAAVVSQTSSGLQAQEQRELFYSSSAAKPLSRTLVPSLVVFFFVLAALMLWKLKPGTQNTLDEPVSAPLVTEQIKVVSNSVAHDAPTDTEQIVVPLTATEPELDERIAALESAINQLSTVVATVNAQPVAADPPVVAQEPNADQVPTKTAVEDPVSVRIQDPFAAPVAEQDIPLDEPTLSITPNSRWQDLQQAQQAKQLVAQGQIDAAVEKLQQFILSASQPRESVKALLDIFAAQERGEALQSLLLQADYLPLVEQTFYAAKVAVIQQQDSQAIQLLEQHILAAEQYENYRALLAGLYQRTGMNVEAANHYRRLLSVFGDKAQYWLGFALAQDALNEPKVAAQAYLRVNQYADLQPQVRAYVQQRIAALHP